MGKSDNCSKEECQKIVQEHWKEAWQSIQNIEFPATKVNPVTREDCIREFNSLRLKDQNIKTKSNLITHFHQSLKYANRNGALSPYDFWQKLKADSDFFIKFYENRLRYSDWYKAAGRDKYLKEGIIPSYVLGAGLSTSRRGAFVSYFKPALSKYLIKKYLEDFDTIFDPCSGYSGRMLGALSLGKNYIGQDINDLSILESKRIFKFLSKHFDLSKLTCDLKIEDSLKSKGQYPCLLTCPPYGAGNKTIEIWKNSKGENIISQLSCEQWIKVFLKNYDCQKYVFVVDDDSNYFSKYQMEEFGNRSHLGTNYERVIVLTKEQRAYEILR